MSYFGIINYQIMDDGRLLGIRTGSENCGIIFSEIVKKKNLTKGLTGIYFCSYINTNESVAPVHCELTIEEITNKIYKLSWTKNDHSKTEGIGIKLNEKQLVVAFQDEQSGSK